MINELSKDYKEFLLKTFGNALNEIVNELVEIKVNYYNFDNDLLNGIIVCNKKIADKLIFIFDELYKNKYQIEKIRLIDEYDFNDISSMADSNTSCFNYRKIIDTEDLSFHAYGLAIDINPRYNPYQIKNTDIILPENGIKYYNRNLEFKHKIDNKDLCYKLFTKNGFEWGGNWEYPDYQHFQYNEKTEN